MTIFNWLKPKKDRDDRKSGLLFEAVRQKTGKLTEEEIKRITGFAGLLGKVAYADMDISPSEKSRIHRVLVDLLDLEASLVEHIVEVLTEHRVQLFSLEDHFYSRMINEVCTKDEKQQLIETLFLVAAVDESINNQEDATLWTIARSLHLSHGDFIAARKRFVEHLDVLKNK